MVSDTLISPSKKFGGSACSDRRTGIDTCREMACVSVDGNRRLLLCLREHCSLVKTFCYIDSNVNYLLLMEYLY
ncbi:hypothetical protein J6590_063951 [Homalodisca vitripennis]|nr:hypothetical protein J6590_063951 [Homalodisca vitripennis]